MASLESKIDELYQRAPSEFTEARNALARTLGGEDARRVKRLEKPTVVPWSINQIYWKERAAYGRLLKAGRALRAAQVAALSGSSSRASVQSAGDAHRKALADAVRHAVRLASAANVKPEPDALGRMLEAVSLSPTPPEPGRMTQTMQPAGFEALAGVTPARVQKSVASTLKESSERRSVGARDAEAERRREAKQRHEEEARRRKAEAEMKLAEHALERARAAETHARRDLEQAEERVRFAAQRVSAARSGLA